jgi:hypothetical protein
VDTAVGRIFTCPGRSNARRGGYPPGVTEPSKHDPDDAEEFAEEVGLDPTSEQIDEYRERIGDPVPEPVEPPD